MEVAGLVLGVIPLVIKALDTYKTILSSTKSAQRDLGDMINILRAEQQILQNTCQILLKDIVPNSELDAITADPFGPAWKRYDMEINMRLYRSSSVFEHTVTGMKKAVDELQQKLAVTENGGTMFDNRRSLLEALKRNAREASFAMSFTLRKKDYLSILERIKTGNTTLQNLASQNRDLEPMRRSGSQFKLARIVRELSNGIFTAFQNVFDCSCNSHDLGLEIAPRKVMMSPDQGQDRVAKSLQFDIVVNMDNQIQKQRWDRVRVRLADNDLPLGPIKPLSPPSTPSSPQRSKSPRRVKFASIIPGHVSDINILTVPGDGNTRSQLPASKSGTPLVPPIPIKSLCRLLQKGKKTTTECYGSISDTSRKFNLFAQRCYPETFIAVQLRKVLEEQEHCSTPVFNYPERLKVALALSYSVFHHYNTPWLAKLMTADDVLLFRERSAQNTYVPGYLDKPLLTKQLSTRAAGACATSTSTCCTADFVTTRRINWTLLSLGFLLVQIIMGSTVDELEITSDTDLDDLLEKQAKASEISEGRYVLTNGGPNYAAAAQWCLNNFLNGASLEDEDFCREFHGEVIDRLETDLKHQSIKF
ncbi:hypothetical protein F5883DRAFT_546234 [Diaporthe sp. PMI_573]|nr:hypothetical protein F5883DRAFT_546234 [Diaporthaceae sp. PMI_573]